VHWPRAIRTRLTVWYGFVLAATLAFLGVIVWATTRQHA